MEDDRDRRCLDGWRAATAGVSAMVESLLTSARIPRRYVHCELANFDAYNDTPAPRAEARDAPRRCSSRSSTRDCCFTATHGVGKTHLAVALMKEVIRRKGARAVFLRDARSAASWSARPTITGRAPPRWRSCRPVLEADLLVLDDLGAEKTSRWVEETLAWSSTRVTASARHDLHDEPQRLRRIPTRTRVAAPHRVSGSGRVCTKCASWSRWTAPTTASSARIQRRGHRPGGSEASPSLAEEPWPRKPAVASGRAGTGPAETARRRRTSRPEMAGRARGSSRSVSAEASCRLVDLTFEFCI